MHWAQYLFFLLWTKGTFGAPIWARLKMTLSSRFTPIGPLWSCPLAPGVSEPNQLQMPVWRSEGIWEKSHRPPLLELFYMSAFIYGIHTPFHISTRPFKYSNHGPVHQGLKVTNKPAVLDDAALEAKRSKSGISTCVGAVVGTLGSCMYQWLECHHKHIWSVIFLLRMPPGCDLTCLPNP